MKRTTVFRQLIRNIIIPLILSVILFSGISYYYNKQELEQYYVDERARIVQQVKDLISLYDFSMNIHEDKYSGRMKEVSNKIVSELNTGKENPETIDLYRLSKQIEVDTSIEFIYLINRKNVIVNTTFKKDLGFDFYKLDKEFLNFFNKIRDGKSFVEDRFAKEVNTGKIKKYSYQPTATGDYVVELGFYSTKANELKDLLRTEINKMAHSYPEIKRIDLITAIHNAKTPEVSDANFESYNTTIAEKRPIRNAHESGDVTEYADYIYLDMMNTSMFDGYVIQIISDDSKERELVKSEVKKFGFIFLVTVIPLMLLVYFRARKITNPIKKLIKKVQVISGGNLDERIEIGGNNEITELSKDFNLMVDKLQESYEGLEQKVRDRTLELSHQKELIEEKNKEITDSIQYARRIQRALLASDSLLKKNLHDHFILYKPKDIVSGDFYWAQQVDNKFLIATADCTGHGVPGAFMSLLNISILNEQTLVRKITRPDELLNIQRENIIRALNPPASDDSTEHQQEVKDGMDCILCCFDLDKMELTYAAANNSFYIIRNNELIDCKADKMPVGMSPRDHEPFTLHTIPLIKGDLVYTFTDGYADQFGGPKGKKFKYKQLEEILLTNAALPFVQQKKILDESIENWRGELEQVDDILVIGIRL